MSRRLILLRHAKAEPATAGGEDRTRPLAPDGRGAMRLVAAEIARLALRPDLALVSPATRTRETWELAGLPAVPSRIEPEIYEASVDGLLRVVRSAPAEVVTLMAVGHNPGFEALALALARPEESGPLRSGLPTAGLVVLDFEAAGWTEVQPGTGRLAAHATPAMLG